MLLIITLGVLSAASFYMLDYSLKPVYKKGNDIEASYLWLQKEFPQTTSWLDSLTKHKALRDTFIIHQNRKLHALYVRAPQATPFTALLLHGYTDNAVRMLAVGYIYHHLLGYNLLLPDLHAHGQSQGEAIQMGWKDRLDVLHWSTLANEIFATQSKQIVHGISMGGFLTTVLSGMNIPQMQAFVDDCGYTSVWDEFAGELRKTFDLPPFPLMYTSSLLCKLLYGWSFGEADALPLVSRSTKPIFFIHGDQDTFVPTEMGVRLYDAKPQPKELWLVPGVAHAHSYQTFPEEYERRVITFAKEHFH